MIKERKDQIFGQDQGPTDITSPDGPDQYNFLNKGITKKEIISIFEHENHRFKLQNEAKIQEKWPLFSVQIYIDDVPTGFFECQGTVLLLTLNFGLI